MITIREALRAASTTLSGHDPVPSLAAELLLAEVLGRERSYAFAHPEEELAPAAAARFDDFVRRRAHAEPLAYILGRREFLGREFTVTPAVLIPRPETELAVEAALQRLPVDAPARVVDVGTGSGCIAVSIALARPQARVTATDISPAALAVAAANARRLGAQVEFLECDLLDGVSGLVDLVVSNPPYVAVGDVLSVEVRDYEPHAALFAGSTGAEIYTRLIPQAWRVLEPGGAIVLELGYDSAPTVRQLLARRWRQIESRHDEQGIERVIIADTL